jgi:transposase
MQDTEFYQQVLGLSKPWQVKAVKLELAGKRVTIEVECAQDVVWGDPATGGRAHVHGWEKRRWRHLDTCQFETILEAEVPRVKYADGSVEEVAVPWAERFSRLTRLMEAFVIRVLQASRSVSEAAGLLGLGWDQVNGVMKRAVQRGLLRREARPIRYLGIDEKSIARGHTYATVLSDLEGSRVWEVTAGRKESAADAAWESLTVEQREVVAGVAMDMWPAFENSAKAALPHAVVVHDKFHVAKHLNEAVDKVRKAEHRKLMDQGDETLKGSKYQWLRKHEDLRKAEAATFRTLHKLNLKTSRAWQLKESFDGFWLYRYTGAAARFFQEWHACAMRSRLSPIKQVARMLKTHLPELLNYITHRITNAASEGFNSLIQNIKANARGLPNFQKFRTRILFYCGKLDMLPA